MISYVVVPPKKTYAGTYVTVNADLKVLVCTADLFMYPRMHITASYDDGVVRRRCISYLEIAQKRSSIATRTTYAMSVSNAHAHNEH